MNQQTLIILYMLDARFILSDKSRRRLLLFQRKVDYKLGICANFFDKILINHMLILIEKEIVFNSFIYIHKAK